jgi:hypothetical protein
MYGCKTQPLVLVTAVTLLVVSCGGGSGGDGPNILLPDIPPSEQRIIPTDDARPYLADSAYSSVLKGCVLAESDSVCRLSVLPFIGHDSTSPTVDDIMQRVVVTHDWMGVRFRQLLEAMPADMYPLFRSVTGIVIGSDVRPSSYSSSKGRIKIDAARLWLTLPEKHTISTDEDYRSNYGADLQFVTRWRLTIGDEYAVPYSSLIDDNERGFDDLIVGFARSLYHELAHANNVIRPENIAGISLELTPGEAVDLFPEQRIDERLYADSSLTTLSSHLYGLAQVRYRDDEPSAQQAAFSADFVGNVMSQEGKVQFYGYYTVREDVTTLFEKFMMKYHYGADTQVGVISKPANDPDAECEEYIVAWGSRNRIADPMVVGRAKWVVEQMIGPSAELDKFVANGIGDSVPLRAGDDWCEARYATPVLAGSRKAAISSEEMLRHERALFRDQQ